MKHQNYLYLEYCRVLQKFRKLQTRFEKRIANNTFQELTARRRYQLLSKLRKLKQRIELLTSRLKLAAAGGSLAFSMGMALTTQEAKAQSVTGAPKVLSIDRTLANDATTGYQVDPDVSLNNDGNFAIVWTDSDGSLQGKGYGGNVDESLEFSIPKGTDTYYIDASIAINNEDQFVVAWGDSNSAVKYMRYEVEDGELISDGPYTAKSEVSGEYTDDPKVALDDEGNFVITWSQYNGSDYDIKARYYTSENVSAGVLDVSQNTEFDQTQPSVDMDDEGNFIIVWKDQGENGFGSTYGYVTGRKYILGVPSGDEKQLVEEFDFGSDKLNSPDVDLNGDGSFVVAWEYEGIPGSFEYIRAQVFDDGGEGMSSVINVTTLSYANDLQIASDKDGGFIIVYEDSGNNNILGKRFNRFGDAIQGSNFNFHSGGESEADNLAVAMNNNGDFVVAWDDEYDSYYGNCGENNDCDNTGVYFKKFSSPENEPYGIVDQKQVNDYSTGNQYRPAIDVDINGSYVVVWEGESDTDPSGIIGQQFNADGTEEGSEFQINTITDNSQSSPDVAIDGSGRFIVTWSGYAGTAQTGIFAQMYDADGLANGSEFRVDQETGASFQLSEPSVDINSDGDAVIVWVDNYNSVNGRIVNGPNSFDGSEFKIDAATDSGERSSPDVAIEDDGDFVVTWGGRISGGNKHTFTRRFNSDRSPIDLIDVQISSGSFSTTRRQSIAMDKNSGDFMVTYTEYAGSYSSILASKYKSDGSAIFEEEELTDYASSSDTPDVSANLQGEFAVVWNNIQGGDTYLALSLYGEDDELIYENFETINPDGYSSQGGVAVALDLDGDAIVATGGYYGGGYNVYTKTIAQPLTGIVDNGIDFIVNSATAYNQVQPDVAQNADGDFVVVWLDTEYGSNDYFNIKAQRYNEKGVRQGQEILINNNTANASRNPTVALNDEGNFMVAWQFQTGAGGEDVFGSVINWDGEVVKDDFTINSDETTGEQSYPDISLDENGDFRVIWSSTTYSDFTYSAIATKKFNSSGVAASEVSSYLTEDVPVANLRGSIAINSDGDIAIPFIYDYDGVQLYLSVFDSSLEPIVEDLEIGGSYIDNNKPAVTANENGEFVVAWTQGSDYVDAYVRKYVSGADFEGDAQLIDVGNRPDNIGIEAVDDGDFIITFEDEIDDSGDYDGIWAQRLSYDMNKLGPEFLVNDSTETNHQNSAIASSPDGSYTIVWEAYYTDGDYYGIMGKQFISHKPTVQIEDFIVDEGSEANITDESLLVNNAYGGDESTLLTVTLLPSEGTLKLDGNSIGLNQQLNEDDLFFLSYAHNGDEFTLDTFAFTVANEDFETGTQYFNIYINPVNDLPTLVNPLVDQTTTGFETFSYTVPANTFTDIETTSLTLSAKLADGAALPSWLSFNPATRVFSGTAPNDPNFDTSITVKVTASDGEASVSDDFKITIASVLAVDGNNLNGVQLFPNPTDGILNLIPTKDMVGSLDLYVLNTSGQIMQQSRIDHTNSSSVINVDMGSLRQGIYLLKLVSENTTSTYKINKK